MSTIQQLKNFIRHGKQARAAIDEQPIPRDASPSRHANRYGTAAPIMESVSKNVHPGNDHDGTSANANKSRKVADEEVARLVADEKESVGKFPKYPGLERWILVEKMGDGAFSNVYRARDRTGVLSEDVAIKVVRKFEMNVSQGHDRLHPNFQPKPPRAAERSNILKEVTIMRKLEHPNIIRLIEFAEAKQYYYIILELAPGGELFHQIVKLTYFSEELSRHVILQVAKALEYLHEEQGVVHRDIKPENILFYPIPFMPSKSPKPKQAGDEDKADEGEFIPGYGAGGIGKIKIADFGLSKVVWETKTTTPCGTVGYTAPEIVKDERYSKSVDMWALGCVLYTLLCGFPPFYDESIEALTEKVAKAEFTFLSPWWDDISSSAKELISHLLDVDPEKRYTITEFLNHPWIRESGMTPKKVVPDGIIQPSIVSRIIQNDRRLDFRSPGVVNLREVFDVGYAVHRQEEEDKRRKNAGTRIAGVSRLAELNEELSEEEEEEAASGNDNHDTAARTGGRAKELEQSMRNTNIQDPDQDPDQGQDQDQPRGRERERRSERGYGQHSATVAAAARQQFRDHNRQKGAFELNLDGATLLGRRGAKPAARVA